MPRYALPRIFRVCRNAPCQRTLWVQGCGESQCQGKFRFAMSCRQRLQAYERNCRIEFWLLDGNLLRVWTRVSRDDSTIRKLDVACMFGTVICSCYPCATLRVGCRHPSGARVEVQLHGATVTSFKTSTGKRINVHYPPTLETAHVTATGSKCSRAQRPAERTTHDFQSPRKAATKP